MSRDQTVAGMRRFLAEEVGEFAAMEFDRMLAEAKADALLEMARFFEDEFADAWGGDLPWITTGKHVADLVAGILRDHAGITDPSP